jgi:hypothetical protein
VFEIENKVTIKLLTKPPTQIDPVFLKNNLANTVASGRINRKFQTNKPASAEVMLPGGGYGTEGNNLTPVLNSHV